MSSSLHYDSSFLYQKITKSKKLYFFVKIYIGILCVNKANSLRKFITTVIIKSMGPILTYVHHVQCIPQKMEQTDTYKLLA